MTSPEPKTSSPQQKQNSAAAPDPEHAAAATNPDHPTNPANSANTTDTSTAADTLLTVSPLRCFSGAFVSGTLSLLAYRLMSSIAQTFADKPISSNNPAAVNIAAAVRTLVIGIVALGAGIFGIAALGLALLGLQLLVQKLFRKDKTSD
jgi:hypothetical protein